MKRPKIKVAGVGWVLPWDRAAGDRPPPPPAGYKPGPDDLKTFRPKEYLNSVKGYLDPIAGYALASAALALGDWREKLVGGNVRDDAGVASVTFYGAQTSAFRFYRQFASKGPRWASPMVFPHGYPNTAGNLVAIEFGFGGPHMAFSAVDAVATAFHFAAKCLAAGHARHMLVIGAEAGLPEALPDRAAVAGGSITVWLTTEDAVPRKDALDAVLAATPNSDQGSSSPPQGAVDEMLGFLRS
ncbi:MAG: hypothetical protein GXP31_00105 [Kiritimatiellaeota bacterium]|nr:hypothetical protein [Kiritimatiellota bacterium]